MNQSQSLWIFITVAALVLGGALGYWIGNTGGYSAGYETGSAEGYAKAEADATRSQQEIARKAADDAAKAANPFQAVNPLEGVEANPFEKAVRAINPFSR